MANGAMSCASTSMTRAVLICAPCMRELLLLHHPLLPQQSLCSTLPPLNTMAAHGIPHFVFRKNAARKRSCQGIAGRHSARGVTEHRGSNFRTSDIADGHSYPAMKACVAHGIQIAHEYIDRKKRNGLKLAI